MATNLNDTFYNLWCQAKWNDITILCQEQSSFLGARSGVWSDPLYPLGSDPSTSIMLFAVMLLVISMTSFVLKPLGLTILSKMFGGLFVIGLIYCKNTLDFQSLLRPTILYILKSFSYLGFVFYSFILGVETNVGALLKNVDKRTIIISSAGLLLSVAFSYAGLRLLNISDELEGVMKLILLNAQTFFLVTCNHVNELGISNSELGRLACTISLVVDIFGIFWTYMLFSVIHPIMDGDYWHPIMVSGTYIVMFAVHRPLIMYIVSFTPEGGRMKDNHFLAIIVIILILAFLSVQLHHPLSIFLFGFLLPQEPLASILSDRLEAITSGVFFPIFCAMHGLKTSFNELNSKSFILEILVIMGTFGKFLGTIVPAMFFGLPVRTALALSIIMASKGLFDIVMLGQFQGQGLMTKEDFTIVSLHVLFCTGAFLPLVRYIYEPAKQYSTIIRQGVITSAETGTLQVLSCIYKEENVPGILRLIQAFNPTNEKPIPVIALQLIPLTAGRVSLPILAPLHEVTYSAAYRSNISRCNRTVNALVSLEHKTHGAMRPQHYISVSSYTAMHNDICNVAHENNVSLLILPFPVQWTSSESFHHLSQSIREVNKKVLEQAPCSLGLLVDRGDPNSFQLRHVYCVAIFFIGGIDDREALAYTTMFANHPSIMLTVIRLISPKPESSSDFDNDAAIQDFQCRCIDNERVSFEEVNVNNCAETTNVVVNMKDEIDLAVVGRYHEPGCTPLFGLSERWCAYPELGFLGDMLAAPDFKFSVLVVQERPHRTKKCDREEDDADFDL